MDLGGGRIEVGGVRGVAEVKTRGFRESRTCGDKGEIIIKTVEKGVDAGIRNRREPKIKKGYMGSRKASGESTRIGPKRKGR